MPGARSLAGRERPAPRRRPLGVRHPRAVLAGALAVLLALGLLGIGVERELKSTSLRVPGTEAARGEDLQREHFGDSAPFAILLRGPAPAIERQGPRLVARLRRTPGTSTLSPWSSGPGLEKLRPNPRTAVILADFRASNQEAISRTTPALERLLASSVSPPVRVHMAGFASVARAIQDESVSVTRRGELIVAPILLIVLLLVFRSPIAAMIPLAFGGTTVIGARGLMAIAANFVDISGFAISIASVIGLALGVDYALLIVSRFREELRDGADPAEAATATRLTAGRTTVFAGATLLLAILVAVFVVPGALLASLCATVVTVIALAVTGPWVVGPAILVLVGRNIDRWTVGRGVESVRPVALSRRALRRPWLAAAGALALILLIAGPALSLATGPLTVRELPTDNRARSDVEAIEAAAGQGWTAPLVVIAASDRGPVTTPRELRRLGAWQRAIARDPDVETVIGPGPLVRRFDPLRRKGRALLADDSAPHSAHLDASLGHAALALARLRRGLGTASEGADALTDGSGRATRGASLIAGGLSFARSGGSAASRSLERFRRGAQRLAGGQRDVGLGAKLLSFEVGELGSELSHGAVPDLRRLRGELDAAPAASELPERAATVTVERLQAAWRAVSAMTTGSGDPRYPELAAAIREALAAAGGTDPLTGSAYADGYEGLPAAIAADSRSWRKRASEAARLGARLGALEQGVAPLRHLTERLTEGMRRLSAGGRRLAGGSNRIVAGAARLRAGLGRLATGSERLARGLQRLRGGNAALGRGLSFAYRRTRPLVVGARRTDARVSSARRQVERRSPRFFSSGYFVLSALDGAPTRQRRLAAGAIDLDNGGQAARMLVIAKHGVDQHGARGLYQRLRRKAADLARASGLQVAITGGVAETTDYAQVTGARLPPLVLIVTVLTFLMMLAILRALPLAAIAVMLNLLAVAAGFGVLALVALLPSGAPLGDANQIDPVSAAGIFGIVFGISIDYAVFLLMRMREGWERTGDADRAIAHGLERTASVIVGAATIMIVVFMVFATAPLVTIAQFGVGLSVAVLVDTTLIRLVLLPTLMKLIGPRVWWLPRGLDRLLPRLSA